VTLLHENRCWPIYPITTEEHLEQIKNVLANEERSLGVDQIIREYMLLIERVPVR